MWLPPAAGGAAFLLLYVLGNLDVIDTTPALAADAFLLASIVLYFPMRYVYRLGTRGRIASALFALAWLAAVYGPVHRRIYPAHRIATVDVSPDALPAILPAAGHGSTLDLVIEGHLEPGVPGTTRAARYRVTLVDSNDVPRTFSGEFVESWEQPVRGRRESVEVLRARTATRVTLDNPTERDVRVTELTMRGRAERRLTLSLYPHTQLPLWLSVPIALGLVLVAVAFDRTTGAGQTAASFTIATAAALTATFAFQSVASPQPTFRELLGAVIVGALVGGPLGGLAIWLFKGRGRDPRRAGSRAG